MWWQLDREQAERLAEWMDFVVDMIEDWDEDYPLAVRTREELLMLLKQDAIGNPRWQQPLLIRVDNP